MGTRVYLWWINVDMWQNQYNIVKLKNKIKKKKELGIWLPYSLYILSVSLLCFS